MRDGIPYYQCNKCNEMKVGSDFYTTPTGSMYGRCRECHNGKTTRAKYKGMSPADILKTLKEKEAI